MNRRAGCANWRTKTVSVRRSAFWTRECRWFSEQNKDLLYRRIFVGCPSLFKEASVAQLVERHLAKVNVEGSNPFARSIFSRVHMVVVYALLFEDGSTYIGLTKELERRLEEHRRRQSPSTRRFQG